MLHTKTNAIGSLLRARALSQRANNNGPIRRGPLLSAWRQARGHRITVVYVFIVIITNFMHVNDILRTQSDRAYSEGWSAILFVWITAKISEVPTKNLFSSLLKSFRN